jgi:hypothetical protein
LPLTVTPPDLSRYNLLPPSWARLSVDIELVGRPGPDGDSLRVEPGPDVLGIEPDEMPDLEVGDAPLGHQPAHMAYGVAQTARQAHD